jgi:TonB family protein
MTRARPSLLKNTVWLFITAFALLPPTVSAQDRDTLEHALNAEYKGKVLFQRRFLTGQRIPYDAAGNAAQGKAGPWTMDGGLRVLSVRLPRESLLEIKAERLYLVYDVDKKQFWDLFTDRHMLDEKYGGKERVQRLRADHNVVITIENPVPYDELSARAAFQKVFLASGEHLSDFVPDYWVYFLKKQEIESGERSGETMSSEPAGQVFKVGHGVTAPRVKGQMPDPEYSEGARLAKFQGTVVLRVVVDPSGGVREVVIARPLGSGLDDKAVEAVRTWQFDPARRDGEPVAVQINVEVNFRLY